MKTQIVIPDITTVPLDGKDIFIIQFRLSKQAWNKYPASNFIPTRNDNPKTYDEGKQGTQFLPPTERMDIFPYGRHIRENYELVDAYHKWMPGQKCELIQFTFTKKGRSVISHAFLKASVSYYFAFTQPLCAEAHRLTRD